MMVAVTRETVARAALAAAAFALGLSGLHWGLPDRERILRVLPAEADTPAFRERMANAWKELHRRLGPNLMINPDAWISLRGTPRVPAGWREPPDALLGPYRSFYIRSALEDEQSNLLALSRLKPWRLELNPHLFTYGGAYLYSLGAWEALGALTGQVTLRSSLAPYLEEPSRMARLYAWGRVLSVVCVVLGAWLLVRIGRVHLGLEAGMLAGFLYVLHPAVVVQSHAMKLHPFWAMLALWTLERCLGLLDDAPDAAWAWAGVGAGATVGSFMNAWPACLIVAAAAGVRMARGAPWRGELRGLCIAASAAVAAFLGTNPSWLTSPREGLAELAVLKGVTTFDWRHPAVYLWGAFRRTATTPLALLALAGTAWGLWRGRRDPKLLLAALAFLLGLLPTVISGNVHLTSSTRYGLGWIAVAMLLAARAGVDAWRAAGPARPLVALALAAVAAFEGVHGAAYACDFHVAATPESTHVRAGNWIEQNVPAGAAIGMTRLPQPSNAPYFRFDRYELRFAAPPVFGRMAPGDLPEWLVVVSPDYDEKPELEPNLARYARAAAIERRLLFSSVPIDPTATMANPLIEVFRLKTKRE